MKKYFHKISHIFKYYLYKSKKTQVSTNIIVFNLRKANLYSRYLYLFIKFLHLQGYKIVLPKRLKSYTVINDADIYLNLLLKEKIINFQSLENLSAVLQIDDTILSPEYFSHLLEPDPENCFYIPMTQHPLLYNRNLWNSPIAEKDRKRSAFMIGNFEKNAYNSLDFSLFGTFSRTQIFEFLESRQKLFKISSKKELKNFIVSSNDDKCILIDRNDFAIEIENLREILSNFYFFLACPGVVIPQSHNLIEALSVGCIPVIQKEYALLMQPPLKNMETAIIYNDLSDLVKKLDGAFRLKTHQLITIQENVYRYYEDYLTPKAVVSRLMNHKYSRIYLQAEFESVRHLKLQKAYKKAGKSKPKYI